MIAAMETAAMNKNYRDITRRVSGELAKMRTDLPDVMKGFGALAQAATRDGALDRKTKELIALALGVAAHCDACIGFHVDEPVSYTHLTLPTKA